VLLIAFRNALLCAAAAACLSACAGNGMGLDQGGRPLPPGGAGSGTLTADFDSIQQHVFTPICTACHAGSNAPQGLHLDAANSYAQLVGVPSVEQPSLLRVAVGDPDGSYIIQKLEGHAASGAQMPFGGPPLPAATIAVIRQWISAGALRPQGSVNSAESLAALSVAPASGQVLESAPPRIIIDFSQELHRSQVDADSVRLEANGETVDTLAATLSVPAGNPRAMIVTPVRPLPAGRRYRLLLRGPAWPGLSTVTEFAVADHP
jgi:hypothetical protein